MFWLWLFWLAYLAGIGACRAALTVIHTRLVLFEDTTYFWLMACLWPLLLVPVATWIFAQWPMIPKREE